MLLPGVQTEARLDTRRPQGRERERERKRKRERERERERGREREIYSTVIKL